jgi:hypothetical protein
MANNKLYGRGERIRDKIESVIGVVANVGVVAILIFVFTVI